MKQYTIVSARMYTCGDVEAIEKERIETDDIVTYMQRYSYPVMVFEGWPVEVILPA